jgi:Transposase DDE domain
VGYDAGKEVKGRKIHALVYSEGLPTRVVVHSAGIQGRGGAGLVLDKIRRRFPWLDPIWVEGVYNAWQVRCSGKVPPLRLEIIKRRDRKKGFVVLPRRWVVDAPSPGSAAIGVSPRTSRTSPKPWPPSLPSPLSSRPSGGSPGRRLRSAIRRDEGRQIGL